MVGPHHTLQNLAHRMAFSLSTAPFLLVLSCAEACCFLCLYMPALPATGPLHTLFLLFARLSVQCILLRSFLQLKPHFPQGNFPDSTAHSLSFLPSISCTLTLVPDSPVRTPGRQGPSLFWSLLSLEQLSWAWLNKYLGNDCVQKSEVPRWDLIPPSPTPQPHDLRPIPIWHLLWGFSFYI